MMIGEDANPSNEIAAQPRCSIIIRAYNEEQHIGRLLQGIMQQNLSEKEIILVDSGSNDKTVEVAAEHPVKILQIQPGEFTFGRSLNHGIQHAKGEFIVIVSAHVYPVYPDWLERLLTPFENPRVALSYGRQRGNSTTLFSESQVFARWFPDTSIAQQTFPFCNNANAAIRRECWELHPYDENLTGLEDLEWAKWAIDQGRTISYVAEAEVIHVHSEAPRQVYNRYRREAMAFKRIYPQEQFHFWDFLRLLSTNILSDTKRAFREGVLGSSLSSILWFRWMQFWGTYQGYHQSGPLTWQLRRTFYYPHNLRDPEPNLNRDIAPIQYHEPEEVSEKR